MPRKYIVIDQTENCDTKTKNKTVSVLAEGDTIKKAIGKFLQQTNTANYKVYKEIDWDVEEKEVVTTRTGN